MENMFGIGMQINSMGIENQIMEILKPVHQECGGTVIIGQSSPQDKGNFKIVCRCCGETAPMTINQRRDIIFALLKGEERRINEKIIVIPPSGD
ncbi:MAG: hypothetical protein NTZ84_02990 [Candidatus Nealsonbacteria bacterium]|nr:hypothetical protein [Candidatus Nealsonbacteria bacterium]